MPIILDINHPTTNFCTHITNNTSFPYSYQIDYIRVYQYKEKCSTSDIQICNISDIIDKTYRKINIGNGSCSIIIPKSSNIKLKANNEILINSNFLIENGAIFEANIIFCDFDGDNNNILKSNMLPTPPPNSFLEHYQKK